MNICPILSQLSMRHGHERVSNRRYAIPYQSLLIPSWLPTVSSLRSNIILNRGLEHSRQWREGRTVIGKCMGKPTIAKAANALTISVVNLPPVTDDVDLMIEAKDKGKSEHFHFVI